MSGITLLKTILSLIPAIIEAIKAVEAAIPGQGNGEKKLAAIRAIIEQVYDKANEIWPSIEKTIAVLVALFNSSDVFKK